MQVANVVVARRLKIDVVNLPADGTTPASCHPLLEQLYGDIDQHRDDLVFLFGGELVQARSLRGRPRKAVENVTVAAVVLRRALFHESNGQLVRNELTPLHDVPDFTRQRSLRILER